MRRFLLAAAILIALPSFAPAQEVPQKGYGIDAAGIPEGAKILLESGKAEYFLGENILIHFGVQNTSTKPFKIETGGDYRGASRALRFKVTAVDSDGKELADPDPSGFYMGGLSGPSEIKPGETFWEGLQLIRYRKLEKPGEITITVQHDLGWGVPLKDMPAGTLHLKLAMPNDQQAAKVVADMAALATDKNAASWTRSEKRSPFADFTALGYPVYLPFLQQRAASGDTDACLGIGSIETPEATAALVKLLSDSHAEIVLAAARNLSMRLPDPDFDGKSLPRGAPFSDPRMSARRQLSAAAWRAEFADPVREAARDFLGRDDQHLAIGAFMFECVGKPADLKPISAALERVILASKERAWKDADFPDGPPNADALERALRQVVARGGVVAAAPRTPGEQAAFAIAVNRDSAFRPAGWEDVFDAMLASSIPYQRQQALILMPLPVPDRFLDTLEKVLHDPDLGVLCRALDLVSKSKAPRFAPTVEQIMKTDRREWVLHFGDSAIFALGLTGNSYAMWIDRMTEPGMAYTAMAHMISLMDGVGGWGWNSNVSSDMAGVQKEWKAFYAAHEADIRAGKKFPLGEGGITQSLIPAGMNVDLNGKPWPARGK